MKRFIYLFILLLLAVLTACSGGSKKTDEGSLILMQDSVDNRGLQRLFMQPVYVIRRQTCMFLFL